MLPIYLLMGLISINYGMELDDPDGLDIKATKDYNNNNKENNNSTEGSLNEHNNFTDAMITDNDGIVRKERQLTYYLHNKFNKKYTGQSRYKYNYGYINKSNYHNNNGFYYTNNLQTNQNAYTQNNGILKNNLALIDKATAGNNNNYNWRTNGSWKTMLELPKQKYYSSNYGDVIMNNHNNATGSRRNRDNNIISTTNSSYNELSTYFDKDKYKIPPSKYYTNTPQTLFNTTRFNSGNILPMYNYSNNANISHLSEKTGNNFISQHSKSVNKTTEVNDTNKLNMTVQSRISGHLPVQKYKVVKSSKNGTSHWYKNFKTSFESNQVPSKADHIEWNCPLCNVACPEKQHRVGIYCVHD